MKILLIWVAVSWGLFLYAVGIRGTYLFIWNRWPQIYDYNNSRDDFGYCVASLVWPIAWPFILAWVMFEILAEKYRGPEEPKPIVTSPPPPW